MMDFYVQLMDKNVLIPNPFQVIFPKTLNNLDFEV